MRKKTQRTNEKEDIGNWVQVRVSEIKTQGTNEKEYIKGTNEKEDTTNQ
jgi:hypothetical protein